MCCGSDLKEMDGTQNTTQNTKQNTTGAVADVLDDMSGVNLARMQIYSPYVHLTWPRQHEDPETTLCVLREQLGVAGYDIVEYSVVQENGRCRVYDPPRPYPHTHAALKLRQRSGGKYRFAAKGAITIGRGADRMVPHVRVCVKYSHWEYIFTAYHKKEPESRAIQSHVVPPLEGWPSARVEGQQVPGSVELRNMSRKEVAERMVDAGALPLVGQALMAHSELGKPEPFRAKGLPDKRPWQAFKMWVLRMGVLTDRVFWCHYDPAGNGGKTEFCKMAAAEGAVILTSCNPRTVARILAKHIVAHGSPIAVIWNIPRGQVLTQGLYTAMECCVDGEFTSDKYDSDALQFERVPVILCTNSFPDVGAVTKSRWIFCLRSADREDIEQIFCGQDGASLMDRPAVQKAGARTIRSRMDLSDREMGAFGKFVQTYGEKVLGWWDDRKIPRIVRNVRTAVEFGPGGLTGREEDAIFSIELRDMTQGEWDAYQKAVAPKALRVAGGSGNEEQEELWRLSYIQAHWDERGQLPKSERAAFYAFCAAGNDPVAWPPVEG